MPRLFASPLVLTAALAAAVLTSACDGDRGADDGGAGDGAVDVDAGPPPPGAPHPVSLEPCRPGWSATRGDDGVVVCDPWPTPRPECAGATASFPGEPACAPIGQACTADPFAATLPASGVIFVDAAAASGSGTREAPFRTIAEATAVASSGSTIAVAKGVYDERVMLPGGVTLRGACPAETTIADSQFRTTGGTIMATGLGARLENVRVAGPNPGVWVEGSDVSIDLEGVLIEETTITAWGVFGARSTGVEVVVRDTNAFDGFGRALTVEDDGLAEVTRAVFARTHEAAVAVLGGEATLRDVSVSETRAGAAGAGDGVSVAHGSRLVGEGLVVEGTATLAAYAILEGSRLELTDSVLRGAADDGLQANLGASVSLTRVRIEDNAQTAVLLGDGTLTAEDLVVRGNGERALAVQGGASATVTRAFVTGGARTSFICASTGARRSRLDLSDLTLRDTDASGVQFQEGGDGSVTRARLERTGGTSVVVRGEGTTVTLTDLDIRHTRSEPIDGSAGRGLEVRVGASAEIEGLTILDAEELGVFIEVASAVLRDVEIRETRRRADGSTGRGIEIQASDVSMSDVLLADNHEVALAIRRGAIVEGSAITITGTEADLVQGIFGFGLSVGGGALVDLTNITLENNTEASVAVFDVDTDVTLRGARIRGTRERPCAETTCVGYEAGIGVGTYGGASVTLADFDIEDHPLCGVQVAGGGVDLADGRIANNPIGVNVQDEGFDYARVMNGVQYIDNGRNVDAETLPVPGAVDPLAGEP